ncbi:hypothetical protein E2C01_060686 [Portunus trituberculatus]|uniref:Uncharacterized protein n=1 Tax=Portunus trituberculatus TaxID=210409 RepID=A0A5B7HB69_PORTR|nr:hypothetical protein [Portunus trituberculatus]
MAELLLRHQLWTLIDIVPAYTLEAFYQLVLPSHLRLSSRVIGRTKLLLYTYLSTYLLEKLYWRRA